MTRNYKAWIGLAVIIALLIFTACSPDILEVDEISEDLPEITDISSAEGLVLIESGVEVTVEANDGDSFEWSADGGSFSDPNSATTTWTAPTDAAVYSLTCTVSNSAGSRQASVSVVDRPVVVLTDLPLATLQFENASPGV